MMDPEHHRPSGWPDYDQDFKAHDNAASWWLMVLALPLLVVALVVAIYWVM